MLRVLELFSGIGACSKALANLGIEHEIVDSVEIDKYAVKSFNAIHGTNFEPQDITKWDKDIKVDLIMHGSPCQDFSVAGKGAGGDKGSGTRSSLMYETLRIVEKLKPKYVIWENVKNLLSVKHRPNFEAYQKAMADLGYTNYYQVLNAKNYGVPQNRERVFTVSILKEPIVYDDYNQKVRVDQETIGTLTTNCGARAPRNGWKIIEPACDFTFPESIPLEKKLKDVLEERVDEKYYLNEDKLKNYNRNFGSKGKMLDKESVSGTLQSAMGSGGGNTPIIVDDLYKSRPPREYDGYSPTLRANHAGDFKVDGLQDRVRKLAPEECWKLMGFSKDDCLKARNAGISDSQLYKQAGNSIVVDVLMAIFRNLLDEKTL